MPAFDGMRNEAMITKVSGICGGEACLAGTRITVWMLEGYRRLGVSDAELLQNYPSLGPEQLRAAWDYVAGQREEIDRAIRENEEA